MMYIMSAICYLTQFIIRFLAHQPGYSAQKWYSI